MLSVCERIIHLSSCGPTAVIQQGFSHLKNFLLNILDLFYFHTTLKKYCFSDVSMALIQESFIWREKKFCGNVSYCLLHMLNMKVSFWQDNKDYIEI